jgi:mannose-6-phosphate isomerase-like protein (cupin superfamily)
MNKVNLVEAFRNIPDHWKPRIVGELNGQHVKLSKLRGDFIWHHHPREDELFLVLEGRLVLHLRDRDVTLLPGEFFIVPRGVDHRPEAPVETHVLLFEPAGTLNTGNVVDERTVREPERL